MKVLLLFVVITSIATGCLRKKELMKDKTVTKVLGGFEFTEGPSGDEEGNLYFSDVVGNTIYRYNTTGTLDTVLRNTGWGNGIFVTDDGTTLFCQSRALQVSKIDKEGKIQIIVKDFKGHPFNGPNDLWVDRTGGIYFTDPNYNPKKTVEVEPVYYISPVREIIRVVEDLKRPNGIIGTRDDKVIYITDQGDGKTWKYFKEEDGTLTEKTLFANTGGDGITLDEAGNLYITNIENSSVDIFSPAGKLLEQIEVPEAPSNVAFAGKDHKELFITARTSVYRIGMNVRGQRPSAGQGEKGFEY